MAGPIGALAAAHRMCERSGWSLTNLQLQKMLYLAQMFHLGQTGERLFNSIFEAWDYGPVAPPVYRFVKMFGDGAILNVFPRTAPITDLGRKTMLDDACEQLSKRTPGQLVNITHWSGGAWAKNYRSGVKGIVIPDTDIIQEYVDRTAP